MELIGNVHWLLVYDRKNLFLPHVDIETVLMTYVGKMSSFQFDNEVEVHKLFNSSGFSILHIEKDSVEGLFEVSEYFRIIYQKQ